MGVATADLFPRVNVTGFVGFLSGDVGRLFGTTSGNDARAWSITPAVSWAAFDIGSVRARLRASEAQSDAAAANYEKVVLTALEDTENSFVAYSARQAQLKSLTEQAQASRRAAELADTQYREGVADFLVLLDAQRTQLDAEDSVAQAQTAVNVSVVAIYKALGGVGQPLAGCCSDKSGANSMRARIGIAMGLYWGGIVQVIDVIAMISALGAIGGLPALLNALTKYSRFAIRWLPQHNGD